MLESSQFQVATSRAPRTQALSNFMQAKLLTRRKNLEITCSRIMFNRLSLVVVAYNVHCFQIFRFSVVACIRMSLVRELSVYRNHGEFSKVHRVGKLLLNSCPKTMACLGYTSLHYHGTTGPLSSSKMLRRGMLYRVRPFEKC